jgi:uncharacterized protein with NAD-binding domain and iron-sulfur cluster
MTNSTKGLSAALELAERGYSVTIKEKFLMGGKLFSEPVQVFKDKIFQVEHGFHGKFSIIFVDCNINLILF